MHPPAVRARVLELLQRGWSDIAISEATSLSRGTVRYMRSSAEKNSTRRARAAGDRRAPLDSRPASTRSCSGSISETATSCERDGRLFLDAQYPVLADEARAQQTPRRGGDESGARAWPRGGLILSDGCAFINRTGRYRYLSYEFRSRSSDIRALFTDTCRSVGVQFTISQDRIRICRRASVVEMAAFVGTKR
jgi:hypothetical protein